jgi:ribosomal protein S27E
VEAQEMNECFTYGEPVVIVGDRHHLGDTGVVVSFDKVADTVVVDLHDHGKHSFPVSHVQHHDPLDNREQEDWYDMSNELMEPHRDPLELANDLEPEVDMDESVGDASVDKIIAYEQGDLSEEDTIALFQELINSGLAWKLQGHYGRTAKQLIDDGYCTMPGKEVDEDNAHDDLRADPSDHDTLMHKNIADAGHEGILDEVDEISLGATGEDKVLTARIIKLDDKNYIEALRTIFPGKDLYKPHDKGDIMVAVDAAKPEARASLKAFLDKHDAAMREAAEPVDEPKELEEKAPPGMESWVKANKAQFKKEYGKKKGTEMLYKTAWSKYNESVEHLSNKLEEEYKKYTVDDARKAGYNLEPLYCKHCGSDEVTYHQGTDSARCQECGKDQDEPVKRK